MLVVTLKKKANRNKATMEYYSAINRIKFETAGMRWMNPKLIIQSEVTEKHISCVNLYTWNLEKKWD